MKNKEFNGFASEAQYEAVKKAVNNAVAYSSDLDNEIDVIFDKDIFAIYVDGGFYSFSIVGDTLIGIDIDNSDKLDDVVNISESVLDIWVAFNGAEREYVATIEDCDFGNVDIFFYPTSKQIIANDLSIFDVPSDFKTDDIMAAWKCYKQHYGDYGVVGVHYNQIADMENLF